MKQAARGGGKRRYESNANEQPPAWVQLNQHAETRHSTPQHHEQRKPKTIEPPETRPPLPYLLTPSHPPIHTPPL